MVKKTYLKCVLRMFRENIVRFIIIAFITAISTALVCGIGALAPRMRQVIGPDGGPREAGLNALADNIERISYVFPVFFIAVTALVVFMTITRLAESERQRIGCYKTLGYGGASIVLRYMYFIAASASLGCGAGVLLGYYAISPTLFKIIGDQYRLPPTDNLVPAFGLISVAATLFFALGVTYLTVYLTAREKPAALFTGRAPRPGGKILLERIPFFWRALKFKYKSALRNIFRYKTRFVMTVVSVLFSTALVFCGLALRFVLEITEPGVMDTIGPISAILIVAAILLNTIVIYNITNINIDERKREIATLKVLGYRNAEVCGYVFREILLLAFLGVLLGLPAGYVFMIYIFDYLIGGGIEELKWYVWLITAALSITSLALTDLFLFRKIHRTDMNGSLKTME